MRAAFILFCFIFSASSVFARHDLQMKVQVRDRILPLNRDWSGHSPDVKVQDFMDSSGGIFLFRVQAGLFIPGRVGEWSEKEKSISTSLCPNADWSYYGFADYVVVFYQNVNAHQLRYPGLQRVDSVKIGSVYWNRLSPDTRLEQISYHDEVKIPFDEANVLGQIPKDKFLEYARKPQTWEVSKFVDALKEDPNWSAPVSRAEDAIQMSKTVGYKKEIIYFLPKPKSSGRRIKTLRSH